MEQYSRTTLTFDFALLDLSYIRICLSRPVSSEACLRVVPLRRSLSSSMSAFAHRGALRCLAVAMVLTSTSVDGSAPLSGSVELGLGPDAPLLVKYDLERSENGFMQFYLAPKIDE